VFDGNLGTFFDAPVPTGSSAGLDLGTAKVITAIKFAPRSGWASRMVGGVFQGSNTFGFLSGVVTLYTVTSTPASGVLTTVGISNPTAFRYVRYAGAVNAFCNVAEVQFFGSAAAVPPSTTGTTGSTISTGSTSWATYAAVPASGTAPRAIMQILAAAPMVGIAVDTRALSSTLGYGSSIDANYQWNFGDPNGAYNTLPGFNATHVYTVPGSYTITLTVTNALHQSSSVSASVKISADSRRPMLCQRRFGQR